MVADAGDAACFAWEESISGEIRNPHTRRAYRHAVRQFLAWVTVGGFGLRQITPGLVGRYLDRHKASIPTRKQRLAALRGFFDKLVLRHVVMLNPAASVRGERDQVVGEPPLPVA
jgi:integrase/recombinase XerD